MTLVLSLFPGIGLLDMAFEEEGFCVVRGPDLLWGGDIGRFHPPAGKFDGVIGGPPCQAWARTRNYGSGHPVNLVPEFVRIIEECRPAWWLMENVPGAPEPVPPGFLVQRRELVDVWCGGETKRRRVFWFGSIGQTGFHPRLVPLHSPQPKPTVIAGGSSLQKDGSKYRGGKNYGAKTTWAFERGKLDQGLPEAFDLPPFTVLAKVAAIGNGVPLAMGRAVAKAVKRAINGKDR